MVKHSLTAAVVLLGVALGNALSQQANPVFQKPGLLTPANKIDQIVFAKLSSLDIQPVLCSDAVFVRRAYLDVIGTLPTAKEAREFIQDPDTKNKRRASDRPAAGAG